MGKIGLSLLILAFIPTACTEKENDTTNDSTSSFTALSSASQVAVGHFHSCAVLMMGNIKCWGSNDFGQLGNGGTSNQNTPVEVQGINNAAQIANGEYHSCALLETSVIKCWGRGDFFQLGNGEKFNQSTPVEVQNIDNALQISIGSIHSCALLETGVIKCWGANTHGQIGQYSQGVPVVIQGVDNAVKVAAGGMHNCVLLDSGSIKCWGWNEYGQLGNGESGYGYVQNTPVDVQGIDNASQVAVSHFHSCAVLETGTIKCWGIGSYSRLGNGESGYDYLESIPVDVQEINNASQVAVSFGHSCALLSSGSIKCWGFGAQGELGNGGTPEQSNPVEVLE